MSIKQAIEALEKIDALIIHQYGGTRAGMTALQDACDDARAALAALRSIPQEEPDVADIIAGALLTSRAHAYELMREALKDTNA